MALQGALQALRAAVTVVLQSMEALRVSDKVHSSGRCGSTSEEQTLLAQWRARMGNSRTSTTQPQNGTNGDGPLSCRGGKHYAVLSFLDALANAFRAAVTNLPTAVALRVEVDAKELERIVLQEASVVLCTVSMVGSDTMRGAGDFSACVVDEAGQLVEAHTAILPHRCPRLRLLLLAGDHMQLPATVCSQRAAECGHGVSTFERLISCGVR
jgi:hypothetical protein